TRGFVTRRGYREQLERRRHQKAPKESRGRNSFSRRAGGHRDVARCAGCKPGRTHRAGGAKALKKVEVDSSCAASIRWARTSLLLLLLLLPRLL
ncbi:unnamed protein product, partial [Polarella glacialis]